VGDAGYHKDPITAQGITDALYEAELLAEAVDEGFGGRRPLEEALADYQKRRDDAVLAMYQLTCELAALEPPPPAMQRLFQALPGNQAEADQFVAHLPAPSRSPSFSPQKTRNESWAPEFPTARRWEDRARRPPSG
jgi:2-polyprenyl-6-methoxyphenol hydroxylase-like FAD-dependent oxidoreductase